MAQTHSNRPLSPHLQIWRWGPAMLVSILHRVCGNALAFGGLGLLLWWLGALASGPEAYGTFIHWVWTPEPDRAIQSFTSILGKIAIVGLTWAFFQHMVSGLRHFVLDVGAGYELETNSRWSIATIGISIVLTILFWAVVLLR
ncbi:succinate dehydrogenase, cytochrome b556 subunit [Novosphingobium lentum]|uniref:succinate dehydrogenase, cytochrome b556 subunit n=1 Tax=Novosphingobium lentum TaxID=145287 RepID=UPI00082E9E5F|nr:succinate dehydrogenase, cytochrome b556 subunit [Novosphingobium lentum]